MLSKKVPYIWYHPNQYGIVELLLFSKINGLNKLYLNPQCKHKMCNRCARDLIEFSLANTQSEIPIKCPHFNEDCTGHFTYLHENAFELCTPENYRRWEYWEIMKTHIDEDDIG